MHLFAVGIEHVILLGFVGFGFGSKTAFARGIVYLHARLYVIAIYVKAYSLALVLYGVRLHQHAAADKLVARENGSYSVRDVVAGFLDIVCDHILKGKHSLHVEITGAGDEVFRICILAR